MKETLSTRLTMQGAQIDAYIQGERWQPLVRLIYTLMAPLYDPIGHRLMPKYQDAARELLAVVGITGEDRVLDLGCGTGLVALAASQQAKLVVGLDMTAGMLRVLRRKGTQQGQRLPLIQADARDVPLADNSMTVVTTSFMLLHLTTAEKQQVFREAKRVLKPGGRLGCLTSLDELGDIYSAPDDWRAWLTAAGFEQVDIHECYNVFRIVTASVPEEATC
jgi:ubiquinone/menaquinone biosynthesis C-methylase UbiE